MNEGVRLITLFEYMENVNVISYLLYYTHNYNAHHTSILSSVAVIYCNYYLYLIVSTCFFIYNFIRINCMNSAVNKSLASMISFPTC